MNKNAYFKLFGLDKKARQGNVIGPLVGALIGGWRGSHIAGKMHKDPSKLLRALYILAGATGGGMIGNSIQNAVQGTSGNLPFISVKDKPITAQQLLGKQKEYLSRASDAEVEQYGKNSLKDLFNRARQAQVNKAFNSVR